MYIITYEVYRTMDHEDGFSVIFTALVEPIAFTKCWPTHNTNYVYSISRYVPFSIPVLAKSDLFKYVKEIYITESVDWCELYT